jgi:hypothetical protein
VALNRRAIESPQRRPALPTAEPLLLRFVSAAAELVPSAWWKRTRSISQQINKYIQHRIWQKSPPLPNQRKATLSSFPTAPNTVPPDPRAPHACPFLQFQHFSPKCAEGEFEEVAGQEEGSTKRVRQVMTQIVPAYPRHTFPFVAMPHATHYSAARSDVCLLYAGIRHVHSCERKCVCHPLAPLLCYAVVTAVASGTRASGRTTTCTGLAS